MVRLLRRIEISINSWLTAISAFWLRLLSVPKHGFLLNSSSTCKKRLWQALLFVFAFMGGEGGIRTHDTVSRIQTFQACSFDHSDTSPVISRFKRRIANL